ncbi:MAG: Hpt domain-containing protein [Bacteroidetes bacterium]|nr:Hpt domain-containing protein [Bacteroidota bacterium]
MMDGNVIDLQYLKELSSGNREFEIEMIDMYLEQTPEIVSEIGEAFQSNDLKKVKSLSHKLKSSVIIFGAKLLHEKLAEIEELAADDNNLAEISGLLKIVEEQSKLSIELLQKEKL